MSWPSFLGYVNNIPFLKKKKKDSKNKRYENQHLKCHRDNNIYWWTEPNLNKDCEISFRQIMHLNVLISIIYNNAPVYVIQQAELCMSVSRNSLKPTL